MSSIDDPAPGQQGSLDRMKYTVSECIDQYNDKNETMPPAMILSPDSREIAEGQGQLITIITTVVANINVFEI